jgi:hypothetical protein
MQAIGLTATLQGYQLKETGARSPELRSKANHFLPGTYVIEITRPEKGVSVYVKSKIDINILPSRFS